MTSGGQSYRKNECTYISDGRWNAKTSLVNFPVARPQGLFIFIHELVSAVAANGM